MLRDAGAYELLRQRRRRRADAGTCRRGRTSRVARRHPASVGTRPGRGGARGLRRRGRDLGSLRARRSRHRSRAPAGRRPGSRRSRSSVPTSRSPTPTRPRPSCSGPRTACAGYRPASATKGWGSPTTGGGPDARVRSLPRVVRCARVARSCSRRLVGRRCQAPVTRVQLSGAPRIRLGLDGRGIRRRPARHRSLPRRRPAGSSSQPASSRSRHARPPPPQWRSRPSKHWPVPAA